MRWRTYTDLFRQAAGRGSDPAPDPFPYQLRLAERPLPSLLHVPTGAGKTAAVTLSWIWRRRFHPDSAVRTQTPRRLVYCLPMRILVEQVHDTVQSYLKNLDLDGPDGIRLHQLLGGNADDDWIGHPEADAILVGTQDMILSRALNRGYGLSRFRWPQPFGLLHNDSLWVFDEIQLFGAGLPTTAQLEAFRNRLGVFGPSQTLWMSATMQSSWLETVDHPAPKPDRVCRLTHDDLEDKRLRQRLHAPKQAVQLSLPGGAKDARTFATAVAEHHVPRTMTLIVLNTVDRAVALWEALSRHFTSRKTTDGPAPDLVLLHSRFRPPDRQRKMENLDAPLPPGGRIVVSTQVVEAGVDISARFLFTELAPWPSIVQRLGRCNRRGEFDSATVYWVDLGDKEVSPYRADELDKARTILFELEGRAVAPALLPDPEVRAETWDVIRTTDLRDLFDTSPDLSGNDIDVSRFIRDQDDLDVYLFWREWEGEYPAPEIPGPHRDELCSAPVNGVKDFLKNREARAWRWDHLSELWREISRAELRPGMTLMLHCASGGYSGETGWNPRHCPSVLLLDKSGAPEDATGTDARSFGSPNWQSLVEHTEQVVAELRSILSDLALPDLANQYEPLIMAARWHDAGKAHHVFQATMLAGVSGDEERDRLARTIWAKSPSRGRHSRRYFRHELASALALLQHARWLPEQCRNLSAYLVAAHHGKVRLTIRALPKEERPAGGRQPGGSRFALGIWEGDPPLPTTDLGGGVVMPETVLGLSAMVMGRGPDGEPSWLERSLCLRDAHELGPFRLAYLEALLRAADTRASARAGEEARG